MAEEIKGEEGYDWSIFDVTKSCIYYGNSQCGGSSKCEFDKTKKDDYSENKYICQKHRAALKEEEERIKNKLCFPPAKPCLFKGASGFCRKPCTKLLSSINGEIDVPFCHEHLPCLCKVSGDCDAIPFPIDKHSKCQFRRFCCSGTSNYGLCQHLRIKNESKAVFNATTATVMKEGPNNNKKRRFDELNHSPRMEEISERQNYNLWTFELEGNLDEIPIPRIMILQHSFCLCNCLQCIPRDLESVKEFTISQRVELWQFQQIYLCPELKSGDVPFLYGIEEKEDGGVKVSFVGREQLRTADRKAKKEVKEGDVWFIDALYERNNVENEPEEDEELHQVFVKYIRFNDAKRDDAIWSGKKPEDLTVKDVGVLKVLKEKGIIVSKFRKGCLEVEFYCSNSIYNQIVANYKTEIEHKNVVISEWAKGINFIFQHIVFLLRSEEEETIILHFITRLKEWEIREGKDEQSGLSIFMIAAENNYIGVCQYLVQNNHIDLNIADKAGNYPIHWFSSRGKLSVCINLLKFGANGEIKNNDGKRFLELAIDKGFTAFRNSIDKFYSNNAITQPSSSVLGYLVDFVRDDNLASREALFGKKIFDNICFLFYSVLESMLKSNEVKENNNLFLRSLLACSSEIVLYEEKIERNRAFDEILEIFEIDAYQFQKVIDIFVRNSDYVPTIINIRHLRKVEESICFCFAWTSGSSLFDDIEVSFSEVSNNIEDKKFLEIFFGRMLSLCVPRILKLISSLNINDENLKNQIWTTLKYLVVEKKSLMVDKRLDEIVLCIIYGVCAFNKVDPEVGWESLLNIYNQIYNGENVDDEEIEVYYNSSFLPHMKLFFSALVESKNWNAGSSLKVISNSIFPRSIPFIIKISPHLSSGIGNYQRLIPFDGSACIDDDIKEENIGDEYQAKDKEDKDKGEKNVKEKEKLEKGEKGEMHDKEKGKDFLLSSGEKEKKRERTDMHDAASIGDVVMIEKLHKEGLNVNQQDESGWTPMHFAASNGHVASLEALFKMGGDIHAKTILGHTPIHFAAKYGHVASLEALFKMGGDIHSKDKAGYTPMYIAAQYGHVASLEALFKMGGDIHAETIAGRTPMHFAAQYGQVASLEALFKMGGDLHAKDENGCTPMHLALMKLSSLGYATFEALFKMGGDIHAKDKDGISCMDLAIKRRGIRSLEALFKLRREDLNSKKDDDSKEVKSNSKGFKIEEGEISKATGNKVINEVKWNSKGVDGKEISKETESVWREKEIIKNKKEMVKLNDGEEIGKGKEVS